MLFVHDYQEEGALLKAMSPAVSKSQWTRKTHSDDDIDATEVYSDLFISRQPFVYVIRGGTRKNWGWSEDPKRWLGNEKEL